MMEIDWRDLVQKLPLADQSEARGEIELTKPTDGNMDFNLAINEDRDFIKVMAFFEKSFIQSAIKRHRSIGECATALKIPRSTLDAKRRKYGLI
jgi:transcriptional regulator with PAS, ATPase and Fis domain